MEKANANPEPVEKFARFEEEGNMRHVLKAVLTAVVLVCLLNSCSLFEDARTAVVHKMYDAVASGDMNAYMDTQTPDSFTQPSMYGALSALSLSVGPVGLDFSKLMKVGIGNLKLTIVSSTDDYAVVQAEGQIRIVAFLVQYNFCDQHDVRKINGKWYVDPNAPERTARIQRIMNSGRFNGLNMNDPSDFQSYWQQYSQMMNNVLNLCE